MKTLCKDFDGQGRQLASKIGGATGHFSQLYTASLVVLVANFIPLFLLGLFQHQ